ncbi:MAG: hypothetical protein ACR2LQ_08205 [Acidimicrobiales bacterium]
MHQLITLIRSLGNAGAVNNARVLMDRRRAEDFALRSLERRVSAVARRAA